MIISKYLWLRTFANAIVMSQIFVVGILVFWLMQNLTMPSTRILNPTIVNKQPVYVGDSVTVVYQIIRYRTCRLEITRLFERPDNREIVLQYSVSNIEADPQPFLRSGSYTATIDPGVLNPDESEITGTLFSRIQYFCNGLDYAWPRFWRTPGVLLTVAR